MCPRQIPSSSLGSTGVVGGLHRPGDSTVAAKARIALLVMYAEQDYTTFYLCTELPSCGFTILCLNNWASKSGSDERSRKEFQMFIYPRRIKPSRIYTLTQSSVTELYQACAP